GFRPLARRRSGSPRRSRSRALDSRILPHLVRRLCRHGQQPAQPLQLDHRHRHRVPGWSSSVGNLGDPVLHQQPRQPQAQRQRRSADH
ncbi:hypothetical protein BN1708_020554, partial [Verticillium longisporum]